MKWWKLTTTRRKASPKTLERQAFLMRIRLFRQAFLMRIRLFRHPWSLQQLMLIYVLRRVVSDAEVLTVLLLKR
jgi:hypothetical protein